MYIGIDVGDDFDFEYVRDRIYYLLTTNNPAWDIKEDDIFEFERYPNG